MSETVKAFERRQKSGWFGLFLADPGIDIGWGGSPVSHTFRRWDKAEGDATDMIGVPDGIFKTVYASHVLEHLDDPQLALRNWWRILAPGGHLILSVPHRDLYEKRKSLPSRWNSDHKTFWLPDKSEPPCTWSLKDMLAPLGGRLIGMVTRDDGYDVNGDDHPLGEYSIEAILKKE